MTLLHLVKPMADETCNVPQLATTRRATRLAHPWSSPLSLLHLFPMQHFQSSKTLYPIGWQASVSPPNRTRRGWLLLLLLLGCEKLRANPSHCIVSDKRDVDLSPATCPADDHCSVWRACTGDWECPSGTQCLAPTDEPATALAAAAGGNCGKSKRCTIPGAASRGRNALSEGFDVAEMELRLEAQATGNVYHVGVPRDARTVFCGLFVADPVVAGGNLGRIANEWKSLHRVHLFRVPDLAEDQTGSRSIQFTISELSDEGPVVPLCEREPIDSPGNAWQRPDGAAAYPIVSSLQVGCWAYGIHKVVAASQLRNVPISDLPEIKPLVTDCAGADGLDLSGRFCSQAAGLGECRGNVCEQRRVEILGTAGAGAVEREPEASAGSASSSSTSSGVPASGGTTAPNGSADTQTDPCPRAAAGGSGSYSYLSVAGAAGVVNGDDASVQADSTSSVQSAPLERCQTADTGKLCVWRRSFVGRCVGNTCVETGSTNAEFPLVVSSCGVAISEASSEGAANSKSDYISTDWLNCYDGRIQGFGTCLEHKCRSRCVSYGDCAYLNVLYPTRAIWCEHFNSSYLGLCMIGER